MRTVWARTSQQRAATAARGVSSAARIWPAAAAFARQSRCGHLFDTNPQAPYRSYLWKPESPHHQQRCADAFDRQVLARITATVVVAVASFVHAAARGKPLRLEGLEGTVSIQPTPSDPAVVEKPTPPQSPSKPASQAQSASRRTSGTISVDQEMLKMRRLFITGDINDDSAKAVVQQLLFLEAEDPSTPVTIFINSGGGLVHSGLALLDVMTSVSMPIHTVAYGRCFSIAAILLAAGAPGQRRAYGNARLMIHEPSCSYPKLQATDIILKADELRHTRSTLESILSARTGRPQADVAKAVARDNYMSAAEAQEFGLVDVVVPAARPAPVAADVVAGCRGSESSASCALEGTTPECCSSASSPSCDGIATCHQLAEIAACQPKDGCGEGIGSRHES